MCDAQREPQDPARLLATIAEFEQLVLLGELVRRYFTGISMAVQGTALPACSSRRLVAPST
ncbi:conserved hypothetical protein [uncultured Mycobacterium sp.]|uniref:Uncharacterized protein n=1 Tax=uncultured Mycobacterium sp. TaxID=171292 RepID=A0A1Y5PC96_9MYCO|nr:conserved hypothetical protein [uncultured Mycobacterium sp.]